jgi:competence protein ComEA
MVAKGATGSDEDFDAILFYLISEFGRVNVNTATAEDIAVVLHLEPKDADRIVRFRNEHGRFGDFEALKKVPGIPVDSLAMLRDAILF